jgi:hypothetical protein
VINPDTSDAMLQCSFRIVSLKPSDVYACLQDVPIDITLAVSQIDWMQRFIPFQSTLAYLRDPPNSYAHPAVDLVGGLDDIRSKVVAGGYKNEYDFEFDIQRLMQKAYEGHLSFTPFLIGSFGINRGIELVSVSTNEADLPQIFVLCKST